MTFVSGLDLHFILLFIFFLLFFVVFFLQKKSQVMVQKKLLGVFMLNMSGKKEEFNNTRQFGDTRDFMK